MSNNDPNNAKAHGILGLSQVRSAPAQAVSYEGGVSPVEDYPKTYLESRSPTLATVDNVPSTRVQKHCRFGDDTQIQPASRAAEPIQNAKEALDSDETLADQKHHVGDLSPGSEKYLRFLRRSTNLEIAPRDEAPTAHRYILRRPRALQAKYMGRIHAGGDVGIISTQDIEASGPPQASDASVSSEDEGSDERRSTDFVDVQRDRVELFIDLLFVGIISNLSEHCFDRLFGSAEIPLGSSIAEFILLFLATWRIWSSLQQFLSAYYLDDFIQRIFLLFVLTLSLIWGNNSPYFLSAFSDEISADQSHFAISTYLIALASIQLMEVIYSIWIPFIRRLVLVSWILALPASGLWVGVILTSDQVQLGLLIAAIVWEWVVSMLLHSPAGQHLQGGPQHLQRSYDARHTRRRYETFFLIALGEGVFLLVRASPLGEGWSISIGAGVLGLIIYFLLHFIYFNGDHTRSYVHSLHRRWYFAQLWSLLHVILYASLVLMSSAILYLIDFVHQTGAAATEPDVDEPASAASSDAVVARDESTEQSPSLSMENMRLASSITIISLAISLFAMLGIALLNRPVDARRTLIVNNRFVRMAPRTAAIAVFAVVWYADIRTPIFVLSMITWVLAAVYFWEWHTGLEKGWQVFEPRLVAEDAKDERG